MATKESGEDVSFFLYLVPIIASIVYGVYEWYHFAPHSSSMPGPAFIVVSKDPYLFLGSIVAVCVGFIFEVRTTQLSERASVVLANATRMQLLAILVLIISLAAGISAGGYDVSAGVGNFLTGRYALIFAFFLVGFSILLSPKQLLGNARFNVAPEFVGLLLMAVSPFVVYGAIKLHAAFSLAATAGIVILIIGVIILVSGSRLFKRKPQKVSGKLAQPQAATTRA